MYTSFFDFSIISGSSLFCEEQTTFSSHDKPEEKSRTRYSCSPFFFNTGWTEVKRTEKPLPTGKLDLVLCSYGVSEKTKGFPIAFLYKRQGGCSSSTNLNIYGLIIDVVVFLGLLAVALLLPNLWGRLKRNR